VEVVPVSWQAGDARWKDYDAVILRSCWNYYQHIQNYSDWLAHMQREQVNLWNSVDVARWNMDKAYLREISAQGGMIPPTRFLEDGERINLYDTLAKNGWEQALIKPRIGASAMHTRQVKITEAKGLQTDFEEMLASHPGGWQIQQFLPDIAAGEYSFIFFRGEFSYAVLKRPADGNIFVQKRLGGTAEISQPSAHFMAQAEAILQAAAAALHKPAVDLLYARVDVIPQGDQLLLVELELMEPGLFLDLAGPRAGEHFAGAIASII